MNSPSSIGAIARMLGAVVAMHEIEADEFSGAASFGEDAERVNGQERLRNGNAARR